jgi:uncharacterized protein (DUF2062 family)
MIPEENRLTRRRLERIARVKRVLRWMPRRTNVHRYPVLKWFASAARKRLYLWSFRSRAVTPALYAGCVLALMPLYGVQLTLAVLLAFALRANLPVLFSLQFLTNPFTVLPAYYACFQIGRIFLNLLGIETPHLNMAEMQVIMNALKAGNWAMNLKYLGIIWSITSLGSLILGTFIASVSSAAYKLAAYEVAVSYRRLRELQQRRHAAAQAEAEYASQSPADPPSKQPDA